MSPRTRSLAEIGTSKAVIHTTDAIAFENFVSRHRDEDLAYSRVQDCKKVVRENDRNVLILHSSGTTGQLMVWYEGVHKAHSWSRFA